KDNELIFVLTDKGAAFDPTQMPEADISLTLEERPIGGLGIFLVRKIMGEVTYQRIDDKNQLEMRKKLK
ncbi:MAG: ATP-binding protein, partial [Bacteroidales bacterium]